MREFTVVIPTMNMGRFLEPLFDSIVQSDFSKMVEEVIFVCEKSTDGSEQVIEALRLKQGSNLPKVRMIQPDQRKGTFVGRYLGAKASTTKKLFFIDSRLTLPKRSGEALVSMANTYPAMSAMIDIDIHKNIYCLYWQRSHETMFKSTYENNKGVFTVTDQNFNSHRTGTTCFYCSRDIYVRISEKYLGQAMYSDDTFIMADIVKYENITLHPDFRVLWEPRDSAWIFLKHLYRRGPGFAQFHFFHTRTLLFYLVLLGVLFLASAIALLIFKPIWGLSLLATGVFALLASTALFVKSIGEFFRLAPLHAAVIVAYGLGALHGVWTLLKTDAHLAPKPESIPQK